MSFSYSKELSQLTIFGHSQSLAYATALLLCSLNSTIMLSIECVSHYPADYLPLAFKERASIERIFVPLQS